MGVARAPSGLFKQLKHGVWLSTWLEPPALRQERGQQKSKRRRGSLTAQKKCEGSETRPRRRWCERNGWRYPTRISAAFHGPATEGWGSVKLKHDDDSGKAYVHLSKSSQAQSGCFDCMQACDQLISCLHAGNVFLLQQSTPPSQAGVAGVCACASRRGILPQIHACATETGTEQPMRAWLN